MDSVGNAPAALQATGPEQQVGGGNRLASAGHVAVVVNAAKFDDLDAVKADVAKQCRDAGWAEAKWYDEHRGSRRGAGSPGAR